MPTQLFTLTGSSAAVGTSALVSLTTLVVSALWFGALADTMDRRRLLLAGNAGLGLTYLGLWLQSALALHSVAVLLVLVALQGVSFGATMTTMGAAVPRVVPRDLLVAANSLSSLTRYVGAVVGPLLAGALIPVVGLGSLYLFDAVALGVVLAAVASLPSMPPAADARRGPRRRAPARRGIRLPGPAAGAGRDPGGRPGGHGVRAAGRAVPGGGGARCTAVRPAAASSSACCSRPTRPACSWPGCSRAPSAGPAATAR